MRKTNTAGRDLIKRFEGCRLEAYQDSVGVWTCGFGHTGDVKKGQKITQHQAEVIFDYDLEKTEEGVEKALGGLGTDNQFSALVAFAFNLGITALANSTLLKKLKRGDTQGAADEFRKWVNAGGKPLPGLVKRREAERALFLTS